MKTIRTIAASLLLFVSAPGFGAELARLAPTATHFRRPVAIEAMDVITAVVANQRSGTLSVVDVDSLAVAAEYDLQGQPSDLAQRGGRLLVTDRQRNRLLALEIGRDSARLCWELSLPTHPVSICLASDGRACSVASLWSRRVSFIEFAVAGGDDVAPKVVATVELPFAPREQLWLEAQGRLIVADGFGDQIAVVRLDTHAVESVKTLPGHNMRGLALSPAGDRVFVSHEMLNEFSPPRASEIIWGGLLSDALRAIPLEKFVDPAASLMDTSRFIMVGNGTRGAGDPDALIARADGRLIIALGGVGEVAIVEANGISVNRIPVGKRPVALAAVRDDCYLVANQLSDSISKLELTERPKSQATSPPQKADKPATYGNDQYTAEDADETGAPGAATVHDLYIGEEKDLTVTLQHVDLGRHPELGPAERGELHFFDARLSRGGWYSCHSCHSDGHSNGGIADTFGDGKEGAAKRIFSLLGVTETAPWGWLGNKPKLDDQLHQTLQLTMQGRKLDKQGVEDLIAYLRTLKPPPPYQPANSAEDTAVIAAGRKLFETLDCASCHAGATFTSSEVYDVGLTDDLGTKQFNPPSLRGVGHRYGLFHDKRAANIDQVIVEFQHQLPRALGAEEQQMLIRYLKSL
ncbi:MAG: hypothetical protein KDA42_09315 [Planctomycetales bacterium]|nr:hypothetical protein [Planctomycetales bacterium]